VDEKNLLATFELIVDLVEILFGGYGTEGDVDHSKIADV
jgi:hypothetical protein